MDIAYVFRRSEGEPAPDTRSSNGRMKTRRNRWSAVLQRHQRLRERLLTWDLLLFQLTDERYRSDRRLVDMLQSEQRGLEQDLDLGFAFEEGGLYADAEYLPVLGVVIRQLHREHDALRKQLESLGKRMAEPGVLDQVEQIHASGMEFSQALRAHMQRNELELLPLVEVRYGMALPDRT